MNFTVVENKSLIKYFGGIFCLTAKKQFDMAYHTPLYHCGVEKSKNKCSF